jgi:hypothetical protein
MFASLWAELPDNWKEIKSIVQAGLSEKLSNTVRWGRDSEVAEEVLRRLRAQEDMVLLEERETAVRAMVAARGSYSGGGDGGGTRKSDDRKPWRGDSEPGGTPQCKNWQVTGRCRFGEDCWFKHTGGGGGTSKSEPLESKPHSADWSCKECGEQECFGSKTNCWKCGTPRPADSAGDASAHRTITAQAARIEEAEEAARTCKELVLKYGLEITGLCAQVVETDGGDSENEGYSASVAAMHVDEEVTTEFGQGAAMVAVAICNPLRIEEYDTDSDGNEDDGDGDDDGDQFFMGPELMAAEAADIVAALPAHAMAVIEGPSGVIEVHAAKVAVHRGGCKSGLSMYRQSRHAACDSHIISPFFMCLANFDKEQSRRVPSACVTIPHIRGASSTSVPSIMPRNSPVKVPIMHTFAAHRAHEKSGRAFAISMQTRPTRKCNALPQPRPACK